MLAPIAFETDIYPEINYQHRQLVSEDLLRYMIESNRNLIKSFHLKPEYLKSQKQLQELAENTEQTMYRMHANNSKAYMESALSIYIFLSDPHLIRDFVLFRFLINLDIQDICLDPVCVKTMLSELYYSDADPLEKQEYIINITSQMKERLPMILYDYTNGQSCVSIQPIMYNVSTKTLRKMKKFRQSQLNVIFQRLRNEPITKKHIDEDQMYNLQGVFSSSSSDSEDVSNISGVSDLEIDSDFEQLHTPLYSPSPRSLLHRSSRSPSLRSSRSPLHSPSPRSPSRSPLHSPLRSPLHRSSSKSHSTKSLSSKSQHSTKSRRSNSSKSQRSSSFPVLLNQSVLDDISKHTENEENEENEENDSLSNTEKTGSDVSCSNDVSETCNHCDTTIRHTSYCTPVEIKNGRKKIFKFCTCHCMENWNYKKCN